MARLGTVLVANRGAVASRVIRALRALGIRSVAVYSEADRDAPYLEEADEALAIGAASPRESYLNGAAILEAARQAHADGIHPGYGFLSENAAFAQSVAERGLVFVGPSAHWIGAMGHKTHARERARSWGLPVGKGTRVLGSDETAIAREAAGIGYPLMVKPAAGGGGIGMLRVDHEGQLAETIRKARATAERGFGSGEVYLERLVEHPRHFEIQVLADRHGCAIHLYDRDCSVQRRHQKVIEEAPAPGLASQRRDEIADRATRSLAVAGYDNIGTVEMLLSPEGDFTFLEMNTRLQVEHGVTEAVTGIDIVAAQVRSASGERLDDIVPRRPELRGHAVEARVCAEDPQRFLPSTGRLAVYRPSAGPGLRIETGYREGQQVTPYYDSLLAKVIAHAATRAEAVERLREALSGFEVQGVKTNIPAVQAVLASEVFRAGKVHTGLLQECLRDAAPQRSVA